MNRRQMLAALSAVVPVAAIGTPHKHKKYGRVTVEGHLRHKCLTGEDLHVWLDGEDITSMCALADDVEGYVEIVAKDGNTVQRMVLKGGRYVSDAFIGVRGDVAIAPIRQG
jgi:hypothetical protein